VYWSEQTWLIITSAVISAVFIILGFVNRDKTLVMEDDEEETQQYSGPRQIVLINEDGTELTSWDLFGRTSLVIGRDVGENQVDINLSEATYAGFIEVEHAVLNYAGEHWYIEDLHSENGIRIQKRGEDKKYKLAVAKPCLIDVGDFIYIAQTTLFIR
jgi:hypothetical protein